MRNGEINEGSCAGNSITSELSTIRKGCQSRAKQVHFTTCESDCPSTVGNVRK
jgi:hypothetical protein